MSSVGASLPGSRRSAESGKGEDVSTDPFLSFLSFLSFLLLPLSFLPFLPFPYFLSTYSALQ